MTSPALQDLRDRIATNTLTTGQQGALTQALDSIIPTFPQPDEISNSIPPTEELLAREWIAALYSIQADGGTPMPPTQFANAWNQTPSTFHVSQGGGPGIVATTPITPTATGKLLAIVTGALENTSDSGIAVVTVSISHGEGVTDADYTSAPITIPSPTSPGGGPISLVVDLFDAAGLQFATEELVEINAVVTVLSGGQAVAGDEGAVQLSLQERSDA